MTQPTYSIRLATTDAERRAVYQLRYRIYVEEMRRPQKDADHGARVIVDSLDDFRCLFAAWQGGECIGTVRQNLLRDGDIGSYREMYRLETLDPSQAAQTSITTRLMILPQYRRRTLAVDLAIAAYRNGLESDQTFDYIDCNAHLVPMFTRLGYLPHRRDLVHPEYGAVTVMKINGRDEYHLAAVRSPFIHTLRRRLAA